MDPIVIPCIDGPILLENPFYEPAAPLPMSSVPRGS